MNAPDVLLDNLRLIPGMESGSKRLVILMSQLGDFDSLEYAQALVPALPRLQQAGIQLLAIGIGDEAGAERFCQFTGFPRANLKVEAEPRLHRALGLYAGLQTPGGPWPGLLLMCAGIGSPGTLGEVFRGYTGDRSAPQRFDSPLFRLAGALFSSCSIRHGESPNRGRCLKGAVICRWPGALSMYSAVRAGRPSPGRGEARER